MKNITNSRLFQLAAEMSEREFAIVETIDLLGLATGEQIERVHFAALSDTSRARVRQRVLRRLSDRRIISAHPRMVGGACGGSGQSVYALDVAGVRLMRQRQGMFGAPTPRRSSIPSAHFLRHVLDVAEVYVRLVEASRVHGFDLRFTGEPVCWWRTPAGIIKPDAYAVMTAGGYEDHWWLEIDRATESVSTVIRQFDAYVKFAESGVPGPDDVTPRILVTVPTAARAAALSRAVQRLPGLALTLITITPYAAAVQFLTTHLHTPTTPNGEQ